MYYNAVQYPYGQRRAIPIRTTPCNTHTDNAASRVCNTHGVHALQQAVQQWHSTALLSAGRSSHSSKCMSNSRREPGGCKDPRGGPQVQVPLAQTTGPLGLPAGTAPAARRSWAAAGPTARGLRRLRGPRPLPRPAGPCARSSVQRRRPSPPSESARAPSRHCRPARGVEPAKGGGARGGPGSPLPEADLSQGSDHPHTHPTRRARAALAPAGGRGGHRPYNMRRVLRGLCRAPLGCAAMRGLTARRVGARIPPAAAPGLRGPAKRRAADGMRQQPARRAA